MTTEFKLQFQFTEQEINAILAGLQELPGKVCNPITKLIHEQAEPQVKAYREANGITNG